MVRLRPSQVYRNLVVLLGAILFLYLIYSYFSDGGGGDAQREIRNHAARAKHLFLTIDKNRMDDQFGKLAPKRIFLWTPIFGSYDAPSVRDCPALENRCIFDHDRSRVSSADAVIFHGPDVPNNSLPPPETRKASQRYVFMTMESPGNTFDTRYPKNKRILPKDYFNWTMTPLFSSDVIFKYGGFWLSAKDAELRGYKIDSLAIPEAKLMNKISAVFGLISNCDTVSKREVALKELNKYINVTIAGKCAETEALKNLCPVGTTCDEEIGKYAFFFAGENTACMDYVSEKYWSRYTLPSIPIILRRKDYQHLNLPPDSVIALDDFASPKEMGEHLTKLARDKDAYAHHFSWRRGGWTIAPWNTEGFRNGYCRLCEKLWEENQEKKIVHDVRMWYQKESQCDDGSFVREWVKKA